MLLALSFVLAYLIGSIPSGVWVGRVFCHKDPRDAGSHNIGTTNAYRVLGAKAGTVVLAMDILKGTLGASLPAMFGYHQHWLVLVCGVAAVIGHTMSIFIHFKGGKAVATSAGILLAYNPILFLVASGLFVSLIFLTSMVSFASIFAIAIFTVIAAVLQDWVLTAIAGALTIVFIVRHIPNIKRMLQHNENMVPFGLGYWHKHKAK
ncbi:glycerol-3-phosphate 1-O-acyltransferase PlsY [Lacticaseibacillus sharpeae]|uniref:Glycerol-3-phosphate acyltransferase n=1 Tax=Lacticaseibacillus sharpeae JCM 1186 = DSM 20505 TaxID=1291052 RepID=A0A0R1ZYI0_9LACO|nr:glycerol-3-phosphate 1-O-acyltransferase PlsY [Lacticaseibacillus sharpeae]KRM56012.1 glycerol-3-phosphate acyltransferase [Lacticaseibacillus sharpeae JCM 1186 = DSM 20505]